MPRIIDYIDKIAREKKRDVLYVVFDPDVFGDWYYHDWVARKELISWCEAAGISTLPCGRFANENYLISHMGELYLDIPYDESDPLYQKLCAYLENPDGSMRIPGVTFCALTLEKAMENANHDVPGFWE